MARTITILTAREVAEGLEKLGVKVMNYTEGDDCVDGEVQITEMVYVQVPVYDGGLIVGRWNEKMTSIRHFDVANIAMAAKQIKALI